MLLIVATAEQKRTITSFIDPTIQLDVAHVQLIQCTFTGYMIQV